MILINLECDTIIYTQDSVNFMEEEHVLISPISYISGVSKIKSYKTKQRNLLHYFSACRKKSEITSKAPVLITVSNFGLEICLGLLTIFLSADFTFSVDLQYDKMVIGMCK